MDLMLAIFGGGIVAGIAYFIGYGSGWDASKREADVVIKGWKQRADEAWRSQAKRFERKVTHLRPPSARPFKPQWDPIEIERTLHRTAHGKHVPIETIEDWSLENRELAYLWALQQIGGRDSPTPLCIMVHVPIPGEQKR